MAESKFDRFFNEMERAARWLHEHDDIGDETEKTICIYVNDGKKHTHSFVGSIGGLISMHETTEMVLKKELLKQLIKEQMEAKKWL